MKNPVCVSNLGRKQKRIRLVFGVAMFVLASALAFYFAEKEAPLFLKVIVFLPFFAATLGFFQAKEKICILFAAQGIQDLDRGIEKIEDPQLVNHLQRQGQKILLQALLTAFFLTFLCVWIH